ncbi:MAG TPA: hypothetical protein VMV95_03740 [Bacillota bacterium]|nr:hypothetical protein [Bacillota bacterium]
MKKNTKSVFWQALILTVVVFVAGIFLGILYEGGKLDEVNDYYVMSEVFLMDSFALTKLTDIMGTGSIDCEVLIDQNIEFANRIYEEAYVLEKYEESGKLTEALKVMHKKYDLLRTLLWINFINIPNKCKENVSSVIYLYEYETEDLTIKATNRVWEKILFDLKQDMQDKIILIPIAADSDLTSLNILLSMYDIQKYPVVIIDETVISQIGSVDDLRKYFE